MTTLWLLACRWWLVRWLTGPGYYVECDIRRQSRAVARLANQTNFRWLRPQYGAPGR